MKNTLSELIGHVLMLGLVTIASVPMVITLAIVMPVLDLFKKH